MSDSNSWRSLYAVTLTLMLFAASSQPALQTLSYYPRFIALAALTIATYRGSTRPTMAKAMDMPARLIVNGMTLAVIVAALSCIWSVDLLVTAQQSLALAALSATIYGLLSRRWVSREVVSGDLAIGFWTVTAFLGAGLAGHAIGLPHTESGYDGLQFVGLRFQGLAANPNMLAVLCVPVIPLAWYLFRERGGYYYLGGGAVAVTSMLMSQSRTALTAVVAAAAIVMLRRGPSSVAKFAAIGGGAVGLGLLSGVLQWLASSDLYTDIAGRFESTAGGGTLNGRPEVWAECLRLLWERPVFGYGYSAGPSLFHQLMASNDLAVIVDVAHNSYLQWLLETGAAGLLPLGFLVAACLASGVQAAGWKATAGLAWLICGGLIMHATESPMLGLGQAYPYIFWVAVAAASTRTTRRPDQLGLRPNRPGPLAPAKRLLQIEPFRRGFRADERL